MNKKKSTGYLIPLILLLTVVPLIVYMYNTRLAWFSLTGVLCLMKNMTFLCIIKPLQLL